MTGIGADQYVWDDADRLARYDGAGTINDTTYSYFPASWQRAKRVKGVNPPDTLVTGLFAWDGANLQALYTETGATAWRFGTPGLDNHISGTTNGNTYYFMRDAQGSIRHVADSGQNTQSTYDYRAYGEVPGTYSQTVQSPFRYTGALYENWHGMTYYMRNREYMPSVGLFSSGDAMWADETRGYTYTGSNPTTYSDPFGLLSQEGHKRYQEILDRLAWLAERGKMSQARAFAKALGFLYDLERQYPSPHPDRNREFLTDALYYFGDPSTTWKAGFPMSAFLPNKTPWSNCYTPPDIFTSGKGHPQGPERGYEQMPGDDDTSHRHDHFLMNALLGKQFGGLGDAISGGYEGYMNEPSSSDSYANQQGVTFGMLLAIGYFGNGDEVEEYVIEHIGNPARRQ